MKLETSYDKVTLDHQEVQQAIKEYLVKRMPDRVVRGDIVTINAPQRVLAEDTPTPPALHHLSLGQIKQTQVVVEKSKPCVTTTAYLYLEPVNLANSDSAPMRTALKGDFIAGDIRALTPTDIR